MATLNPFDLLGDADTEDLAQIIAAQIAKEPVGVTPAAAATATTKKGPSQARAELPSKPLPPNQAVREARSEVQRGGGRGRGRGRGGRGYDRDHGDNENSNPPFNGYSGGFRGAEDGDGGKASERHVGYSGYGSTRGGFRGGRRGGFSNGDASTDGERPPRRVYERHSGSGRGRYENKREGAGRGNWGTPSDDIVVEIEEPVNEGEKIVDTEKQSGQETIDNEKQSGQETIDNEKQSGQETADNEKKDSPTTESDEKKEPEPEPEPEEMTLEEYEKVLEEKRKALLELKSEERKVDLDKELKSMKLLSNKKNDDEVFVKLGTDKDKRKEAAPGDKAKKSVSINEFLKPVEGETYHRSGGRGRGRGSGNGNSSNRGRGYGGSNSNNFQAPSIGDVAHFPTLGAK